MCKQLTDRCKQTKINKRTGRKCSDYSESEQLFQEAQKKWADDINDKQAWDTMWSLIQQAVFNNVNSKLEGLLPKEEIEGRALDVTMTIMAGIKKKRENGKEWTIDKVSSYVYLPCLAIYNSKLKFADHLLTEDYYSGESEDRPEVEYNYNPANGNYEYEKQKDGFEIMTEEQTIQAVQMAIKYLVYKEGYKMNAIMGTLAICDKWKDKAFYHMNLKQQKIYLKLKELLADFAE